jgi:phosphatidylglycerol:prolipoprotein diacylglycerol transferase
MADLVAPSMMLGLAIGRIGCLFNGCCYGGECSEGLCVAFPPEAPAYLDQLLSGKLASHRVRGDDLRTFDGGITDYLRSGMVFGFRLDAERQADGGERVYVGWVEPGGDAEQAGLKPGDTVIGLMGRGIDTSRTPTDPEELSKFKRQGKISAEMTFLEMPRIIQQNIDAGKPSTFYVTTTKRRLIEWPVADLPARSVPIHPTQIYSAIDAFLLFLVLWYFYPFRRHDGEVVALMLTLHPISRFLLEVVRIDEGDAFPGIPLTISQIVGIVFFAAAMLLWFIAYRSPRGSALPLRG